MTPVDFDDVQGLLRFGHGQLAAARYLLLRVVDRTAARAWLAAAQPTTAVRREPLPATALQIAFTSDGLHALGVPASIVADFSPEFVAGLGEDDARARRLGDIGPNDPSHWAWGVGERRPHVLVLLYASPERIDDWSLRVIDEASPGLRLVDCLAMNELGDTEPFGFADGVSQPTIDWDRRRAAVDETRLEYGNRVCLGEFLLGYPNEYGGYSDRPLVAPTPSLPSAEDDPSRADLGRNGSYLVLRQLKQDVGGFWRFLDRAARGDEGLRLRWAEAMVGRTRDGTPLVGRTHEAIEDAVPVEQNAFTYRDDPDGLRCPFGAHVRRANPRNADLPLGTDGLVQRVTRILGFDAPARERDRVSSTRFHRLLRRGRTYGAKPTMAEALDPSTPAADCGIHFVCLGANIARQFEFVQGAWLMSAKFDGLHDERDPLVGHREPAIDGTACDGFSMPRGDGPSERIDGLPTFVTVVGGGYFFLPGLRALRHLVSIPVQESP